MYPSDRVAQLYPQARGSLYIAFYGPQGYCGDIVTRLHTGIMPAYIDSFKMPGQTKRERMQDFGTFPFHLGILRGYTQLLFALITFMEMKQEIQQRSVRLTLRPRIRSGYQSRVKLGAMASTIMFRRERSRT
jgi:hypothetical protein